MAQSGEGNGNSLQYSCLENPMDRENWRATVHRVARVGNDSVTKPPPPPWLIRGFPDVSAGKETACNSGDARDTSQSPGEGNGNPIQYFCLGNPMDRGIWQATVHRVMKSQIRLSD